MKITLNILLFACVVIVATAIDVILKGYGVNSIISSISMGVCFAVWWYLKDKIKAHFEKHNRNNND